MLNPQGYSYGVDPTNTNPFWDGEEPVSTITATAEVDDTTGTPEVEVTKTMVDEHPNFNFAFTGLKGETGETGPQGATGPQGPQGLQGETGPKGDTGAQGPKGDTGATGPQGPKGDKGDTGATGPQGPKGDTGATGEQGPKGDKGDTGATGATGATGPQGETGPQGPQGIQGPAGNDGTTPDITMGATVSASTGTPGVTVQKSGTTAEPVFTLNFTGLKGETGPQGTPGTNGTNGTNGADGADGVGIAVIFFKEVDANGNYVYTVGLTDGTSYDITSPKGPQGAQGTAGTNGTNGVTPSVSATASVGTSTGTPSVTVTRSGTDAQPSFAFAFDGLKGESGGGGDGILKETNFGTSDTTNDGKQFILFSSSSSTLSSSTNTTISATNTTNISKTLSTYNLFGRNLTAGEVVDMDIDIPIGLFMPASSTQTYSNGRYTTPILELQFPRYEVELKFSDGGTNRTLTAHTDMMNGPYILRMAGNASTTNVYTKVGYLRANFKFKVNSSITSSGTTNFTFKIYTNSGNLVVFTDRMTPANAQSANPTLKYSTYGTSGPAILFGYSTPRSSGESIKVTTKV